MSVEYGNLNYALAQKKRFDTKPAVYKVKKVINLYKSIANHHLKNFNTPNFDVKKYKTRAQSLYNQGKYKQYVKYMHELLRQLKATQGGFIAQSPGNIPETPPSAPPPPASPNVKLTIENPGYVGSATMKRKENLVDMFNRINIVGGIKKIFLRKPGNKFVVLARKDKNEANTNIEKYREMSLRLDVFVELDGKNATIQFFSTGTVIITGKGDEKSLKNVASKFNNIENVKIRRDSGTFHSGWGINFWNEEKMTAFLNLCYSKKYHAVYEPNLANPIIIGIHKTGERKGKIQYKHNLLFHIKGGIQFSTSDLTECKNLLTQLLKEALKKGLFYRLGLNFGKNKPPKKEKKEKTTCKNPPTPATFEGDCAPGYYCRPNAQGFPCCYKIPENLTVGRRTAIAAYKKAGVPMPEKVKKLLHIVGNVNVTTGNKQNIVWNAAKGVMIRKRACMRYSAAELGEFAKKLGIDWAKEKKKREGQRKKLPEGGWKQWLCAQMASKLAQQGIVVEHKPASGSASSHNSYHIASNNKPILIEANNRTHKLTILPGPPIVVRGFVRLDKRRKVEEITQRRCDTLDRDVLEKIARRLGFDGSVFKSKAALCQEIYNKRKNVRNNVPANSTPFKILKAAPDGNCFYEAFLRSLTGGKIDPSAKQMSALRKKVHAYLTRKYARLNNNYLVNENMHGKMLSKKNHLAYVLRNGAWAGQAEVKAVAREMNINIIVMTPKFKVDKRFTQMVRGARNTVFVLYNGVNHFDGLLPKGNVNIPALSNKVSSGPMSPPRPPANLPNVVGGNMFASSSSKSGKSASSANTNNLAAEMMAAFSSNKKNKLGNYF